MNTTFQEKRQYPRVPVNLPLAFRMDDDARQGSGTVINASQSGLLIQTFSEMPVGKKLAVHVSFPERPSESYKFSTVAQIIWRDLFAWEDLEGYQYGLKFIHALGEDYLRNLKEMIRAQARAEVSVPRIPKNRPNFGCFRSTPPDDDS